MTGEVVALYVRVSTSQQAQHDLSIPDQLNQLRAYAEQQGDQVGAEFVEAGASARDDQRPVLQDMIARALAKPPEFKRILVHSMSRFFRDGMWSEWYRRKLALNGVEIVSITQDFGTGEGGMMAQRFMALIDEMNSVENAKHVRRTMLENARQGYWNGSEAPLGFKSVVADIRGTKQKKRLAIDPEGAELIRLIYCLYLEGDGSSGPLGIKHVVRYLNDRGYKTPRGNRFHVSYVNGILKDEVYVGRAWYGMTDSRTKQPRPKEDWVMVPVPALVSEEDFQRVQVLLLQRSPKKTPPRLVNSPILLSGLARCGACGSPMHRHTGKGGSYGYYRCSGKTLRGACEGGSPASINATVLDQVVLDKLLNNLLTAERVQAIVSEVAATVQAGREDAVASVAQLQAQRVKSQKRLQNLINALAEGIVDTGETFQSTVKAAQTDVERLTRLIAAQERLVEARMKSITLAEAEGLAAQLREKLLNAAPSLRKRIVRSFVESVFVSDNEIVIVGAKSDLAELVTGTPKGPATQTNKFQQEAASAHF